MDTRRRWCPSLLTLAVTTALAGCSSSNARQASITGAAPVPTGTAPAAPRATSDVPQPSQAGEGTVRRIAARSEVPLNGYRVDAHAGDWLLENRGKVAVVDARAGRIVDFGSAGGGDALIGIEPALSLGADDLRGEVATVSVAPDHPNAVRIERVFRDQPLRLWTFVSFTAAALRIESVAVATAPTTAPVTLGEKVSWGNVETWVQGHGFIDHGGTFLGDFIAREGLGEAYALGRPGGPLVARFYEPQAGFHAGPRTGEETATLPKDGGSTRRVVLLAHAAGAIGDAAVELLRAEGAPLDRTTLPGAAASHAVAEIASCGAAGDAQNVPFARFALGPERNETALPKGCFRERVTAPGYVPGAWTAPDRAAEASDIQPHAGRLHWHVTDRHGATLPARLLVRGIAPTPDPDWGDEPHDGAALEAVVTLGDGSVAIPAGHYRVTVSRGFEYTTVERTIAVEDGSDTRVDATLDRVVDTRGWISADLHVHAVPSPDAPTLLDDRIRSLAASGVEVAAATDHNAVTDYAPTIRALGAQRWLASIVGDEITTRGVELGHFNVFPLAPGDEPVPFADTTPAAIFAAARAAPPADADKIVQVNHPRMGPIGYFEILHLDPNDFPRWRQHAPLFDGSFDALEVYNGDDYAHLDRVETCLRDWYALLNAGLRVTATGNSDSHKLTYHEAGVPRNFVRLPNDTPEAFDSHAFVEAVRHGRVVVSSGPFVELTAGSARVGDEVAPGPAVEVHVRVSAPPWVDVSSVEIVRRGEVVATWTPPHSDAVVRLDASRPIALRSGDWIVAIARGSKPLSLLHRAGALPFAFTNPIRVR